MRPAARLPLIVAAIMLAVPVAVTSAVAAYWLAGGDPFSETWYSLAAMWGAVLPITAMAAAGSRIPL
jgi:hypothetical protein